MVGHELLFTLVDWLCLPLAICLVGLGWRLRHSLVQIWSQPTEARRRLELLVQCALALSDLPFFMLCGTPVVLSGYRAPSLLRMLWAASPPQYKQILAEAALSLVIDVPFLLAGALVVGSGWRLPLLLRALCAGDGANTAADRRLATLTQLVLLLLDVPALLAGALVVTLSLAAAALAFVLAPLAPPGKPLMAGNDGPYRLGVLRRALRLAFNEEEKPAAGADFHDGLLALSAQRLRLSTRYHVCAIQQGAALLLMDLPIFLVAGLPLLTTGWRACDVVDLIADPQTHGPPTRKVMTPSRASSAQLSQQPRSSTYRSQASSASSSSISANALRCRVAAELLQLMLDLPFIFMFIAALLVPWRSASAVRVACTHRHASDRRQPLSQLLVSVLTDVAVLGAWLVPLCGLVAAGYTAMRSFPQLSAVWIASTATIGLALLWTGCRAVRAMVECCVEGRSEAQRHAGALHELTFLLLDVPYVLSLALLQLTAYRMPELVRAQSGDALGSTRSLPPPQQQQQRQHRCLLLRRYQQDSTMSHRLSDHGLVLGGGIGVCVDLCFLLVALPALCAPWRCSVLLAEAFPERRAFRTGAGAGPDSKSSHWTRRIQALKHGALVPIDIFVGLLAALTAIIGPWRLPLGELRELPSDRNVFMPAGWLMRPHSSQAQVRCASSCFYFILLLGRISFDPL